MEIAVLVVVFSHRADPFIAGIRTDHYNLNGSEISDRICGNSSTSSSIQPQLPLVDNAGKV